MQGMGSTQKESQRAFSVLDRLLITHPVWLQLSLNQDTALYILLREPVGVRSNQELQKFHICTRKGIDCTGTVLCSLLSMNAN